MTTKSLPASSASSWSIPATEVTPVGMAVARRVAIDGADGHAEGQGPPRDLGADGAEADDPEGRRGEVDGRAVHRVDHARAGREADPCRLAADRLVAVLDLAADVGVQVAGEAEDVAQHLVGDDVAEQPAHVGQRAGVRDQGGEEVVFQAGRERLHPAQAVGAGECFGRDLAEEGVGPRHGVDRRCGVGRVDPFGRGRFGLEHGQALGLDRRVDDELHRNRPGEG